MRLKLFFPLLAILFLFSCKQNNEVAEVQQSNALELNESDDNLHSLLEAYERGETIVLNGVELTKSKEEPELPKELQELFNDYSTVIDNRASTCDNSGTANFQAAIKLSPMNSESCNMLGFYTWVDGNGNLQPTGASSSNPLSGGLLEQNYNNWLALYPGEKCVNQTLKMTIFIAPGSAGDCVAFRVETFSIGPGNNFTQDVCFSTANLIGGYWIELEIGTMVAGTQGSLILMPNDIDANLIPCTGPCPSNVVCF